MIKVAVIGGGPAGMIAAAEAAKMGAAVTVFEKNERPLRKLMITGKGRCNLTNSAGREELLNSVTHNKKFLYSAFSRFECKDTVEYFENLGVRLKTERGGRIFPVSDKAVTIVDALVKNARDCGVKVIHKKVSFVGRDLSIDGERFDRVIIATGGKSYPLTGSTGDGYVIAKQLGHSVTPLTPSLVPLCTEEKWCSSLSGLSLKNVVLSAFGSNRKKPVFSEIGEMLFCHFGISGPLVLSASAHMDFASGESYEVLIDLKPGLDADRLDKRIQRDLAAGGGKEIGNIMGGLIPVSLGRRLLLLADIPLDIKAGEVTREMRRRLVAAFKELPLHITGPRPIEEAIVTRGGISVNEVDPRTCASKIVDGLYFAGEILDVDAYTGGFNLQIAFSTGYVAGRSAAQQ